MNVTKLRSAVSRFKKYGGVVTRPVLRRRRLAMAMAVGILLLLPLLSGDPEVFVLNAVVIGLAALVIRKLVTTRRRQREDPDADVRSPNLPASTSTIRGRLFRGGSYFFAHRRRRSHATTQQLRRYTMNPATMTIGNPTTGPARPRRSLEELVDRLMAVLTFPDAPDNPRRWLKRTETWRRNAAAGLKSWWTGSWQH